MADKCEECGNNYIGGPKLGNILRASVDTPYNQGKVIWQTNVKNTEKNYPGGPKLGNILRARVETPYSQVKVV